MLRDRLELDAVPDAVPRARRFVAHLLETWDLFWLIGDAELAVAELTTNALLHAGPPIAVVVHVETALRIAVHDPSPSPPIRSRAGPQSMTGRGLALLTAASDRWGVERTEGGKAVWCELDLEPETRTLDGAADPEGPGLNSAGLNSAEPEDIDTILAAWDDSDWENPALPGAEQTFRVTLGDVPTDLLLAAKAHVDNVVRELTLMRAGAEVGGTTQIPTHVALLVEDVVHGFANTRNAIKRQALEADAHGEERVRLAVTLPASAADAAELYLAGLDDADAYARAERLLTLEESPQHRVFRHWYIESLVTQLRWLAAGEPVESTPTLPTFEQYLLREVDTIAAAHRTAARVARLQHVTAALALCMTPPDVADVVVNAAVATLGADAGALFLTEDTSITEVAGQVGYRLATLEAILAAVGTVPLPIAVVASTSEPVWVESREERDTRFPHLTEIEPPVASLCVVPLVVAGQLRGILRFSFSETRLFDAEEREFVVALAAQTAQAIERAYLYDSQARLADRLTRLQQVSASLTTTREVREVTRVVIDHAVAVLGADVGTICLLSGDGETLDVVAARWPDPERSARFQRFPLKADLPAAECVRTGAPIVVGSRLDRDTRYPILAGLPPTHEHTLVCLPLTAGEQPLGALQLSLPGSRAVDETELEFLTALADVCAQALDRAQALEMARAAEDKLAFLTDASAELASALDYRHTLDRLAHLARLAVPRLGDWCTIHVVEAGKEEGGRVVPLAVAHVEEASVALVREVQARHLTDLNAPTGVASVIRTGKSELYSLITENMLASVAHGPEHLDLLRRLRLSSLLVAPLAVHERVFGAITLGRSTPGLPYDQGDLALAENLGHMAALSIEVARLYRDSAMRTRHRNTDPHRS